MLPKLAGLLARGMTAQSTDCPRDRLRMVVRAFLLAPAAMSILNRLGRCGEKGRHG